MKLKFLQKCEFCGIEKETTKEGMSVHRKYCKANPNAKKHKLVGYKHSEKSRKNMSISRKKAFKEGKIKRTGWLDRQKKNRSYAEQWLKEYIDNNCTDLNYKEDYPIKNYLLDFAWLEKQICIEMDGEQHFIDKQRFESDRKKDKALLDLGWKVLRIRWKECLLDKEQFKNIIYNFIEKSEIIPFEKRYKSKKEIYKEYSNQLICKRGRLTKNQMQERLSLIKPFLKNKKFGWIHKCSEKTKLTPSQIRKVCKYFDIDWETRSLSSVV